MSAILCTRCVARSVVAPVRRSVLALRAYSAPDAAPLTPSPVKPASEAHITRSSTLVGTKLDNINYFKNKADPVALEDSEYPAWLWKALDASKAGSAESAEEVGDLYCASPSTPAPAAATTMAD